ncbi:MAG TPA: SAM-dependent methyltransferase [Alphaproteobacteria bacterium]|nr:SAM-dependent methyltransferase [Alphaproteobacteria bacterium]
MEIDFGKTAKDYGQYRAGFPDAFFDRIVREGFVQSCHRLLDLGTGTGTVARGFALRGCHVTGLDPSSALMAEAKQLDAAAGVTVQYIEAKAEATGLPDASFDLVSAGQCWHWFDRARAAAEVRRVLKPGGRLIICHFDWIPQSGNVAQLTEALIEAHNPHWKLGGGKGIYPRWLSDMGDAGFQDIETFSFDIDAIYSHAAWRGRIRASAGVAASLPPDAVARFDAELQALLSEEFPEDPLRVLHRVWAATAVSP